MPRRQPPGVRLYWERRRAGERGQTSVDERALIARAADSSAKESVRKVRQNHRLRCWQRERVAAHFESASVGKNLHYAPPQLANVRL